MTYQQALDYLLGQLPFFQRIGPAAYKANLDNTIRLAEHFANPERNTRHIHIAGTNGKGSVAHMLASVLQEQGYKTGLATSPHLKDFRERIKVNGIMIPKQYVKDFVQHNLPFFKTLQASFFEISMALTFKYFSDEKVDIAVIETGLGGRLDSTNIIHPDLSVITNIGYDHTNLLGNTLGEIAFEKAGIIKEGVPVVVGLRQAEVHHVFERMATQRHAALIVAGDSCTISGNRLVVQGENTFRQVDVVDNRGLTKTYLCDLTGQYQSHNLVTALAALEQLNRNGTFTTTEAAVKRGLSSVISNTGLAGRWQQIRKRPRVICDTGHNVDGIAAVVSQILSQKYHVLRMVFGMVADKNPAHVLPILPADAVYYFCAPAVPRAMPAETLSHIASGYRLHGKVFPSVKTALANAIKDAKQDDLIFVGGSTFVVAEVV